MGNWVAVVDDDVLNLKMAGQILSKHNFRVSAMKSGEALLSFIKDNLPDLILLDIAMPDMDGFETLRRLREQERQEHRPEIPVVFLTADESLDTESKGFELGVSDFIRKPFYPEVLLKRIDKAISQQKRLNRFEEEATIDKLTGFLNKAASEERISELCRTSKGCMMIVDLDSFKLVNDIYGHDMGDRVLTSFAEQMRLLLPDNACFGRVGGDEFLVFAEGEYDLQALTELANDINARITAQAEMLMGSGMQIPLGASLGAVLVPEHGTDYAELYRKADRELYIVKRGGKHGCSLYKVSDTDSSDRVDDSTTIRSISMILNERNIPDCALWLEKSEFLYVYRFLLRYINNYSITACKMLLTLTKPTDMDADSFDVCCSDFGEFLKNSLRKSDIMMRSCQNQYFVLLMEIEDKDVEVVYTRLIEEWNFGNNPRLLISQETEFLSSAEYGSDDRRSSRVNR